VISGRKAFQRSCADGVKLLNTIQDVYLCEKIAVAEREARALPPFISASARSAS
jgi:hypothetical protein